MKHKQQLQEKSARVRNIFNYFKEHALLNGWLYYELIGSLTEQNYTNTKNLLIKLLVTTVCQLVLRYFKSPSRNADEKNKK